MRKLRLGKVDYANCLPIYTAIEEGTVHLDAEIIKGPPTTLNKLFLEGKLDITPISSIEFARNADKCMILPNMAIGADGEVMSIMLFSKVPVTELEGKTVCLTSSSATSVVLLKILLEHYYQVSVNYISHQPDLEQMLELGDAALLIGDDAMRADVALKENGNPQSLYVTDLGESWKIFTGEAMVFAVWVMHKDFAMANPEKVEEVIKALDDSRAWSYEHPEELLEVGKKRYPDFSPEYIQQYFYTIKYNLDQDYRRALCLYYDYAYKSGLIPERVKISIWGESSENR